MAANYKIQISDRLLCVASCMLQDSICISVYELSIYKYSSLVIAKKTLGLSRMISLADRAALTAQGHAYGLGNITVYAQHSTVHTSWWSHRDKKRKSGNIKAVVEGWVTGVVIFLWAEVVMMICAMTRQLLARSKLVSNILFCWIYVPISCLYAEE